MGNQYAARLGVLLGIDTAEFTVGVDKAVAETRKLKRTLESEMKAAEKEIQRIKYAVEDYGKEVTAVTLMQRQLSEGGRYANLAKGSATFSAAMLKEAAALDAVREANKKLGSSSSAGMDRYLKQALAYQTTDIVTSLAGGQNPLMVLLQQGGQLRDQFGGFKPLFAGIAEAVTISKVAFVGAAAAVGALAYGFYQGSKEAAKFRDDLILTNNYAGVTTQSFDRLSASLSDKLNISISDTKDIFSALVSSGAITRKNLESVAEVIGNVSRLSGESADVVANSLLPSMDGTASSAEKLNAKYHFLNIAQFKHIEALNRQGKASEALNYQNDLLNKSFEDQERKLGLVEKGWNALLGAVGNVKSALFSIGKEAGDSQLLDAAVSKLKTASLVYGMAPSDERKKQMDAALEEYQGLRSKISGAEQAALKKSEQEAEEQRKIKQWTSVNGAQKAVDIELNIRKQGIEAAYQDSLFGSNEMQKLGIESAQRIAIKTLEIEKTNIDEKFQLSAQRYKELGLFVLTEEKKTAQQKEKISRDTFLSYDKKAIAEKDSLDIEKQRIGLYQSSFWVTKLDSDLAERKLQTQQAIAEIVRDMNNGKLGSDAAAKLIEQQEAIGKTKDELITLGDRLQYVKDVNSAVFQTMTQSIQAFLITGKLSFKDFAISVIASIMQVQAQWMAMQAMRGIGSLLSMGTSLMSSTPGTGLEGNAGVGMISGGGGWGMKATGGFLNGPSIVGENGPELFVPQGAGTIIPNQQLSSYGNNGGGPVFNGPYIASMNAIDTQSGIQFLAKNKMTIWSMNQSANRSIPSGR